MNRPFFQLITLALYMVVFAVVCSFLAVGYAFVSEGVSPMDFLKSTSNPAEHKSLLAILQIFTAIGTFLVPALVLSTTFHGGFTKLFQFRKSSILVFVFSLLFILSIFGVLDLWVKFTEALPLPVEFIQEMKMKHELNESIMKVFLVMPTWTNFLGTLFVVAFLAALTEEFLFRGALQPIFTALFKNHHAGILFTSIIFAMFHLDFFNLLAITFISVIFGYIYYYTKNLWVTVVMHFVNNGMQVLLSFLYQQNMISMDISEIEHVPYWVSGICIVLSGVFLFLLYKQFPKIETE